jgi:RNA polymerase primary sigma factor
MRQLQITKSITSRDSESLNKYLQEIGKIDLLNSAEELELAKLTKQGDKTALNRLVKANLRFVVSVAKKYQHQGISLADLVNEGNIGLIEAAKRFDETKGFKFISYAIWWIRQYILLSIANQSKLIRIPYNLTALNRQVQKKSAELVQELEREPTEYELAEELHLETRDVAASLNHSKHISLDSPLSGDDEITMLDVIEDSGAAKTDHRSNMESLRIELTRCLDTLTDRQKLILCYYFGIGMEQPISLDSIAEKLYLSRERVRQIKDKAIEHIRNNKQSLLLKKFI